VVELKVVGTKSLLTPAKATLFSLTSLPHPLVPYLRLLSVARFLSQARFLSEVRCYNRHLETAFAKKH
jgi:hypothetical protein